MSEGDLSMRRIAIIGGTGFGAALVSGTPQTHETDYGTASLTRAALGAGRELLFLARHGAGHRLPPHRINHRANIAALRDLGAEAVFATAAVGSLRREIVPGDFVVLDDFLDCTKGEVVTFFGEPGDVRHTDFIHPYDTTLRETLLTAAGPELATRIHPSGTYLCVSGPRYETPAEVRLFAQWGAHVVGMTSAPEAILCREAGLRYAGVALATNYGTGLLTDAPLSHAEVEAQMADRRDALAAWLLRVARLACFVFALLMAPAFGSWGCSADPLPTDRALFGPGHKQPQVKYLRAGPIHVKFADGELHYLTVGSKEIVRRIYFAVRESNWDTTPPKFTQVSIQKRPDSFQIHLQAVCRSAHAAYHWHGEIVGTANGQITFTAGGAADDDFASPRIGLCVLYGAGSLAGQAFGTTSAAGVVTAGAFPRLVSAPLVAADFQSLRYVTAEGMRVSTTISGTRFDMEDQRNYGDSSFKAYSALAYAYPKIVSGEPAQETVTVEVGNAHDVPSVAGPVRIHIGKPLLGLKMPRLGLTPPDAQEADFVVLNGHRKQSHSAASLTWSLCPSVHLPDDDNLMDNVPTVRDQLQTARSFAPDAGFHIAPVSLDRAHRGTALDPRYQGRFAAAWTAAVIKYLALGGAADAGFDTGGGPAAALVQSLNVYAGRPLLAATTNRVGRSPVEALAVDDGSRTVIWLINLTDQPQAAIIDSLPVRLQSFEVRRLHFAAFATF